MKVIRCLHTAILVKDLLKSEPFYTEILGLEPINRQLRYPGIWYQVGDYQLHLIEDSNYSYSLTNEYKWGRNTHIAIAVDDLEQCKQRLTKFHYPVQMSASGRKALFVKDPDGNIIEISQ